MKKKLVSTVLCAGMVASMLAGCGGASSSAAATEAPATDAATEATEGETAAPAESNGKTLTYWSMWGPNEPQAVVIQEAIDAFQAQTGYTVNVEWKNRDIQQVIQAALDSKTQIDLFDEDFQRVSQQYAADCLDLEELAKGVDYESYANAGLVSAVRGWAGSLKAIPYQPYTSGIFYNQAAFDKAGITEAPQTWAEFLDVCQKLKDNGIEPLALDDAYVRYNFGFHLSRYIGQAGVSELVKNGGWAESEGAKSAAQDMIDFVSAGYLATDAPDAYPASENMIGLDESVAMVVNASWVPGEITGNTECDLTWGMFNYPSVEGGTDPNTYANMGAQAFAIPAYSENADAAFQLITMITSGEYDQKMAQETKGIPADSRNTEWPEILSGCRDAYNQVTGNLDWNMGLNDNADVNDLVQDNVLKLFEGKFATADEFLAAMDAMYK